MSTQAKNELGAVLKAARGEQQLTLRAVEEATGISNAYLSQVESGKVQSPSPRVLFKLSQLYSLAYAELMKHADYPIPEPPHHSKSGQAGFLSRFSPISEDEKERVEEYMEFLRSRSRG